MKTYELNRSQVVHRGRDDVFAFFASAENLEMMTPPWLQFRIVTQQPIQMQVGTRIEYVLRLHGVAINWISEITAWEPPFRFIDEQRRGPYRLWVHEHRFEEVENGTRVVDHVRYAVPGGALVHRLLVAPDLDKVFGFRRNRLAMLFGAEPAEFGVTMSGGSSQSEELRGDSGDIASILDERVGADRSGDFGVRRKGLSAHKDPGLG